MEPPEALLSLPSVEPGFSPILAALWLGLPHALWGALVLRPLWNEATAWPCLTLPCLA